MVQTLQRSGAEIWGFPKIRGTFLGVPIISTIVFWGLYWGSPILGNHHICAGFAEILPPILLSYHPWQESSTALPWT